jgi:diacylglycerol O-acyltransferase / wax synthase
VVTEDAAWGGDADLSAWEALMWRSEADPRTRSTGILLEVLDGVPEWERFLAAHERTTTAIPRLRERVVEPLVPVVQPAWASDPHFDLGYHVRTAHLDQPGSHAQLITLCESLIRRPLDRARPPWEAILVTGLANGQSAYLLKFHHSLTDGLGLVQLLTLAHSQTEDPGGHELKSVRPAGPALTPATLLATRVRKRVDDAPGDLIRRTSHVATQLASSVRRPQDTVGGAARWALSLSRMMRPPNTSRSPLLKGSGGVGSKLLTLDVPLDQLRLAGKAAGASVNDAFVASVLGAMRRYHEHHGVVVEKLPIAMPVSLRHDNDPLGGNRFAGARFSAPIAEPDPVTRMHLVREFVVTVKDEPAIGFLDELSPALTKLPSAAIIELSARLTATSDLQVSNIRGIGHAVYLAGVKVIGMYPFGPRPGVAAMIAMITYNGVCCLGLNVDPDAFPDPDVLLRCLRDGFDEVLAVGTEPAAKPVRIPTRKARA